MKKLLQIALLLLIGMGARAQTNQNSDPATFSISSVPVKITAGGKGQIEVAVANLGSDPMIANTFLVNITFDPAYLEVDMDDPSAVIDPVSAAVWTVLDYGTDYVSLVNSGGVINAADIFAILVRVKSINPTFTGTTGVSVNVSVDPNMVSYAGDADVTNNFKLGEVPLPVKLVSFTATKESRIVNLAWRTSEESNASHFQIERSADGKAWNTLGNVQAGARTYTFTDASPLAGGNLYRLKMIDYDATFAYSPIRSVSFDSKVAGIALYPNPASDQVSLTNVAAGQIKEVQVLDKRGGLVLRQEQFSANGLAVNRIENGTYIVKVFKTDGSVLNLKMVVAR